MAALEELAAFVLDYCDAHPEIGSPGSRGVEMILIADVLPDITTKQAALYGFADQIGATNAAGFNPTWNLRRPGP